METLQTILLVLQVIIAISLIGFILIQHGKGADAGAAFGSGASSTVFGSSGSGNFLSRTTAVLAVLFLSNSLFLSYLAAKSTREQKSLLEGQSSVVIDQIMEEQKSEIPEEIPVQDSEVPVFPSE